MRRALIVAVLFLGHMSSRHLCVAQINVDVRLDKERYLAGEPVYLVWEYANIGSTTVPFDGFDPYCAEPDFDAPPLALASPPVFPHPLNGIIICEGIAKPLGPGERYVSKYLLNHHFILRTPGTYEMMVPLPSKDRPLPGVNADLFNSSNQSKKLTLVLQPTAEKALRDAYKPYFGALTTAGPIDMPEAVRALADSGQDFTENTLLMISSDPRNNSYVQPLANEGLARLRTPAGCARIAELAAYPELHQQQRAIEQLGRCGDPDYMMFLFRLANTDAKQRPFAMRAAAEVGGDAAVDRLVSLASQDRESALYSLGLTGSERAVKILIEELPLLPDSFRFTALSSLRTLTHRESKQKERRAGKGMAAMVGKSGSKDDL
jgi:hypothetical protein